MTSPNPYRAAGTFVGASYVERRADRELRLEIRENVRYPYIVAARQSGKSSLLARTMALLDPAEIVAAFVDVSTFGVESYSAFWKDVLAQVARSARLDTAPLGHDDPEDVFTDWLRSFPQRLVVFIDEIDTLVKASFRDQFFAKTRSLYNQRAISRELTRLQIVLAGAAHPDRLIQDKMRSPFNVGIEVEVEDLSLDEVRRLSGPLEGTGAQVDDAVAGRLYHHTHGSIYLSQRVLEDIWSRSTGEARIDASTVDEAVQRLVDGARANVHFTNIYKLIFEDKRVLYDLERLHGGKEISEGARQNLRICGISTGQEAFRNEVYRRVFGPGGPLQLLKDIDNALDVVDEQHALAAPAIKSTGRLFAARYRLQGLIGSGGTSKVYRAQDVETGRMVAVKLLRGRGSRWLARAQREASVLREYFPGVVALIDLGLDEEGAFIVTEYVEGSEFPGRPTPCKWWEISGIVARLLDTLSSIHAAGIIHRDLKPSNVLITRGSNVRVLGFGMAEARSTAEEVDITRDAALVGTLGYMAPERILGNHATRQSDLYALGVMLYEALSGRRPNDGLTMGDMVLRTVREKPAPLSDVAPGVPAAVVRTVDALLAKDPEARPASAEAVLTMLRGDAQEESSFPWFGSRAPVNALIDAVRSGASIDIVGPPGSGRTRCLLAMTQVLERSDGRKVVFLPASENAFASLAPLVGSLADADELTLDEMGASMDEHLRTMLAAGTVVVADDIERIDPLSAASLVRCRDAGVIVRAFLSSSGAIASDPHAIVLKPIREEDLRSLYHGPDRLLHLREDAARALHLRTGGAPAYVVAEVERWVQAGRARWIDNRLQISREALDEQELELIRGTAPRGEGRALPPLSAPLAETLEWAVLAGPHCTPALLSRAMATPRFRVEASLEELVRLGALRRGPNAALEAQVMFAPGGRWPEEKRRAAHLAIAKELPEGARERFAHLLAAGDDSKEAAIAIAAEGAALAGQLIDEGRPGKAIVAIGTSLRALKAAHVADSAERRRLFELWVLAAIENRIPELLERVVFALRREPQGSAVEALERLATAALARTEWAYRTVDLGETTEAFSLLYVAGGRYAMRVNHTANDADAQIEEDLLESITAKLDDTEPRERDQIDTWWGRLRLRQGYPREAAALHLRVAARTGSALTRLYSMIMAAWALIEASALDAAGVVITAARETAAGLRSVYHETLAAWMERIIAYRFGTAKGPEMELAEAVAQVGINQLEGLILLNEAAVARSCEHPEAQSLARKAHDRLSEIGDNPRALLARCLMSALGEPITPGDAGALARAAFAAQPPEVGLQALALLAMSGNLPRGAIDETRVRALAGSVPPERWAARLDVLSIDETLEAIFGQSAGEPR